MHQSGHKNIGDLRQSLCEETELFSFLQGTSGGEKKKHRDERRVKMSTDPEVAVSQVRVVVPGVGAVDGLFAVNLNHAAVLNVPRVLQLIEDVPGLVFDQQSRAGRPETQHSAKPSNWDEPSQRQSAANDQRCTANEVNEATGSDDAADGGVFKQAKAE